MLYKFQSVGLSLYVQENIHVKLVCMSVQSLIQVCVLMLFVNVIEKIIHTVHLKFFDFMPCNLQ